MQLHKGIPVMLLEDKHDNGAGARASVVCVPLGCTGVIQRLLSCNHAATNVSVPEVTVNISGAFVSA